MRVREDASCRRMQRSNNRRGSSTGLGDQRLKCRVHIQWTLEVYIPVYMSRMRCIVPVPWRYSTVCWTPKRKDSEKRKDSVETRLNASQSCTHAICTGLESCMGRGSMKCSTVGRGTRDMDHQSSHDLMDHIDESRPATNSLMLEAVSASNPFAHPTEYLPSSSTSTPALPVLLSPPSRITSSTSLPSLERLACPPPSPTRDGGGG